MSSVFTGTLTHNSRNKNFSSKHLLMINIYYKDTNKLFRDHCWVEQTPELINFQPKTNLYKNNIEFRADIKDYMSLSGKSKSLIKIHEVKKVK